MTAAKMNGAIADQHIIQNILKNVLQFFELCHHIENMMHAEKIAAKGGKKHCVLKLYNSYGKLRSKTCLIFRGLAIIPSTKSGQIMTGGAVVNFAGRVLLTLSKLFEGFIEAELGKKFLVV